jgi:DHA1 family inner membrane transport protein
MLRFGHPRAVIALGALTVSTFTYVTTETLPIGLLPLIADDLHASWSAVGLLVSGYGLVVVVATIPLTRATHRLPRRALLSTLLGVFVVATAASALASTYWSLLAARLLIALSQAVFWSVVTPVAAGLFDASVRGRAVSILYAGSSLAGVLGVPAGTWIGQATNWRVAFLVLSGLGLLGLVVVATLLPDRSAGEGGADRGSAPDAGRYRAVVVTTALAVTGAFASFTYVSPFLTDVGGLSTSAVGPALLARGVAGVVGVVLVGLVVDRNPWLTMTAAVALQAVALSTQYVLGTTAGAAVVAVAASGFGLAALSAVLGARVLVVAPGSTDMAAAGTSTAFNVGITAGALIGGVLLPAAGVRSTALAGAVLTLAALATVLAEPAIAARSRRRRAHAVATSASGPGR